MQEDAGEWGQDGRTRRDPEGRRGAEFSPHPHWALTGARHKCLSCKGHKQKQSNENNPKANCHPHFQCEAFETDSASAPHNNPRKSAGGGTTFTHAGKSETRRAERPRVLKASASPAGPRSLGFLHCVPCKSPSTASWRERGWSRGLEWQLFLILACILLSFTANLKCHCHLCVLTHLILSAILETGITVPYR